MRLQAQLANDIVMPVDPQDTTITQDLDSTLPCQPVLVDEESKRRHTDHVSMDTLHESKRQKTNQSSEDAHVENSRKPKRKVACLIGYCGTGFHGMQLNPPNRTIESTLFEAFVKTGAVSSQNADDPKKVSFLRAARTDKGVHASINVISLKMILDDPDIVKLINNELPPEIRIWKIVRTMNSFNPRTHCDSRIYEYLIPSSAFLPPSSDCAFSDVIQARNLESLLQDAASTFWTDLEVSIRHLKASPVYLSIQDSDLDVGPLALDSSVPEELKPAAHASLRRSKMIKQHVIQAKRKYRISPERLELIRSALLVYKGTKNFHNFTVGQTYEQQSSKRVIRSFTAGEPFLINDTEWISLKVHGQSFMLHQIRKMVAMVLLVVRSGCPLTRMNNSFGREKINIPKAPSLGLLLERPIFDVYNQKASDMAAKEGIEMPEMDDDVSRFKKTHIYDKIYAEEEAEATFYTFLSSLDAYGTSGEFKYLFDDMSI